MAPRRAYGAPIILDLGATAPAAWRYCPRSAPKKNPKRGVLGVVASLGL
jgi:hypothetical protein